MRLLAIGYPLPNPSIDNYNALTAPSYFDYDALFVDPASITRVARQVVDGGDPIEAFDGRPVINGNTTAAAVSAADQLKRRLRETERLLEQGGVVIVLARPNATQTGIVGFEGCDRYSWLPAPEAMSWSAPLLSAAEGTNLRVVDDHHPLAPMIRDHRRHMGYRAVFDARHSGFQRSGAAWAEARPGLAAGAEFRVLGGRVVFAPVPVDDVGLERTNLAAAVVSAAGELLGLKDSEIPPAWVRAHPLPGLSEAEGEVAEQRAVLDAATERLEDAAARAAEVGIYRDLLWSDGPAFREAVRRALVLLGFEETGVAGAPLAVRDGDGEAFVEFESSRGEVAEWPYIRLQRRLEEHLLRKGTAPKGVVIVNGLRHLDPAEREKQATDPLRIACENYRYALLTSESLFALARMALEGADAETLEGVRRRILRGSGPLTLDTLRGVGPEGAAKGPLF